MANIRERADSVWKVARKNRGMEVSDLNRFTRTVMEIPLTMELTHLGAPPPIGTHDEMAGSGSGYYIFVPDTGERGPAIGAVVVPLPASVVSKEKLKRNSP